jgi:ribosome-binding ATPase YchF (GTP1/OBG family)
MDRQNMKTKDKLVQGVIDRIAKRSDAGIKKFGCTMLESKKPTIAWINDTQEELADAIMYIERLKYILKEEENEFEKIGGTD